MDPAQPRYPLRRLLSPALWYKAGESCDKGIYAQLPDPVRIFDPACGSGFSSLKQRESFCPRPIRAWYSAVLTGLRSHIIMTESCLSRIDSALGHEPPRVEIAEGDSLRGITEWGNNDLIFNEPTVYFVGGLELETDRQEVRRILGDRHARLADYSYAFVARAIDSLESGSVVASVVPASFLDSSSSFLRSGRRSRAILLFPCELIGKFRGFNYFRGAMVEPAAPGHCETDSRNPAILNSWQHIPTPPSVPSGFSIRVIMAERRHEDEAIRGLLPWRPERGRLTRPVGKSTISIPTTYPQRVGFHCRDGPPTFYMNSGKLAFRSSLSCLTCDRVCRRAITRYLSSAPRRRVAFRAIRDSLVFFALSRTRFEKEL